MAKFQYKCPPIQTVRHIKIFANVNIYIIAHTQITYLTVNWLNETLGALIHIQTYVRVHLVYKYK